MVSKELDFLLTTPMVFSQHKLWFPYHWTNILCANFNCRFKDNLYSKEGKIFKRALTNLTKDFIKTSQFQEVISLKACLKLLKKAFWQILVSNSKDSRVLMQED